MLWLAIVGIVFAVIGAFYYLRVIKVMYFDEPVGEGVRQRDRPPAARGLRASTRWRCCVLGIFWNPLMALVPGGVRGLNRHANRCNAGCIPAHRLHYNARS